MSNAETPLKKVFTDELVKCNFVSFSEKMYSESDLFKLSKIIKKECSNHDDFLFNLLFSFSRKQNYTKELDWNVGSTIQHFDPSKVIFAFNKLDRINKSFLFDSIGLSWVFGEFKMKDTNIIEYLYNVVRNSRNSEAWWRAAFSLEMLGQEEAVTFLKRSLKYEGIESLKYYLDNINNKKSIIGILLLTNNYNLKQEIFPALREVFLTTKTKESLINSAWLLGRFKLIDKETLTKMIACIESNQDYELTYYTFSAIQQIASSAFLPTFKKFLEQKDPLLRKMAVRGISNISDNIVLTLLENALLAETNPYVISEITKALYKQKNVKTKEKFILKDTNDDIENGLIIDESDKWYADPSIYEAFSLAQDPENVCLNLVLQQVQSRVLEIKNPIDLATGTGRAIRYLIDKINFEGFFWGIDRSQEMLIYLDKIIGRSHAYVYNAKLENSSLTDINIATQSNFIISSFGFPSKTTDRELAFKELQKVHDLLLEDGIFITIGWDETYNDELNHLWFKYIPDNLGAYEFETWRKLKADKIKSPRNCDLKWFKTGIDVPLQFNNVKEAAYIMGNLFGRDCATYIVNNDKIEWNMSIGITLNTKKEIEDIIKFRKL